MRSISRTLSAQQLSACRDALGRGPASSCGATSPHASSDEQQRQHSHRAASTSSSPFPGRSAGSESSLLAAFMRPSLGRSLPGMQYEAQRFCRWLKDTTTTAPDGIITVPALPAPEVLPARSYEVRMEAQLVFDGCWRKFEEKYDLKALHVPREVVWLNGAPGSGKGANTRHILSTRGLDHSICLSSQLLAHPDAHAHVERGDMIPDHLVGDVLLEQLLLHSCQTLECGVLVDGFPRTAHQVNFLKLLSDKLGELHQIFSTTAHRDQFPRPLFKVVMLYVDEETSIARQLERARIASMVNKRIVDACAGELREQRTTDLSIEICRKRYAIFKQHYNAIMRLKQFFPFHLIDAMGSLAEAQEAIGTELRYQSSLDLSEYTYSAIRHLPLARDLAEHARQQLVQRLDTHAEKHDEVFQKVIEIITADIMPVLHESGLAGNAYYVSEARLFSDQPRAAQVLIDVLTDRGFSVSHTSEVSHVPTTFDLATGAIKCRRDVRHRFNISWDTRNVRDMARVMEIAERLSEAQPGGAGAGKTVRISQSFIPTQYASRELGGSAQGGHTGGTHAGTEGPASHLAPPSHPSPLSTVSYPVSHHQHQQQQQQHHHHAFGPQLEPGVDYEDVIYGS